MPEVAQAVAFGDARCFGLGVPVHIDPAFIEGTGPSLLSYSRHLTQDSEYYREIPVRQTHAPRRRQQFVCSSGGW